MAGSRDLVARRLRWWVATAVAGAGGVAMKLKELADSLPKAEDSLIELIQDAMIELGPDGHCDGAEDIAKLVHNWHMEHWPY